MTKTRVYLPSTLGRLREIVDSGEIGSLPLRAHAVTAALRTEFADRTEEDREDTAMSAAALDSIGLLAENDPPRRVVIVVDIDDSLTLEPGNPDDPTLVQVREVLPARTIAAVHVDSRDAEGDAAAARAVWADAQRGDHDAVAVVERCLEHELGWFATQEIGDLLEP